MVRMAWPHCRSDLLLLHCRRRGYYAKWSKYMFYVFYPAHIWILYTIGMLIRG
ncbi:hypothetical protein C7Y44_22260 [Paenibacillus popilliae]|uniref:TraX protein n=1 Tax=Paenibacillus popilliae TaxID=78057 RepID=A0ABY3ARI4_PAEPP|nr:hypothetical protein C7Y44_22260 [Paenibacillus sp. SDF0028]